jgi:AcrR family transcriptional regulator
MVREISLGDIARRVGLAKSNLLRYFEPALIRAHVDFEDRLQQLLSSLITGFLNPETPTA